MLRRIGQSFAAQVLRLGVSLVDRVFVVAVLLRAWGTDIYADWAILLSCATLLSLAEFGLNIHYGNVWQKAHVEHDVARFQRILSVALGGTLLLGLCVAALGLAAAFATDLPRFLSVSAIPHAQALAMLGLMALATISRMMRGAISQVYRGRQSYAHGVVIDAAAMAALAATMIVAAVCGASPIAMAFLYLASDLTAGWGLMLWDQSRRWPDLRFRPVKPTWAEVSDIAAHVRWLAIMQGAPLAWNSLPVVLLGAMGANGNALVSFLMLRTLANLARQIASLLSISAGIEVANLQYAGNASGVVRQLELLGRFLSAMTGGIAVAVALFGESFLAVWSGHDGLFDPTIAATLFGAAVITAPSAPVVAYLMLANSARPAAIAFVFQLAIGLAACAALAGPYDVAGAAVGLAVGEAMGQAIALPLLAARQIVGFSCLRYLKQCALATILTAAWSAGIGYAVATCIGTDNAVGLFFAGAMWCALGLIPALIMILPAHRREAIVRHLARRGFGTSRTV